MPYPGSQLTNTVAFAYWLDTYIIWIRILALAILSFALISVYQNGLLWEKISFSLLLAAYGLVAFFFNFRYEADAIFQQPNTKSFTPGIAMTDKSKLVIGVVINGEAKAYPIQLIGYHHQVRDVIGNTPVMITYCTVCRTGRVYSPIVNGVNDSFRLVGMDHFNAVFEDATTKSWWRQATGVAITGPLKGKALKEFPSRQLTMDAWLRQFPNSLIMQADTAFMDNYFRLEDYDRGVMQSPLVRRDLFSWQPKSWIVGVRKDQSAKAYDWNDLVKNKIIQDSISSLPILLTIENDTTSFHVYDRHINGLPLSFVKNGNEDLLTDLNTNSTWNMDGLCIAGILKGKRLAPVQAYNEFWHSWRTFHKNTEQYKSK